MDTKIFVIEIPKFSSILDKIGDLVGDVLPKVKENVSGCGARCPYLHDIEEDIDNDDDEDLDKNEDFNFTPSGIPMPQAPWDVAGKPQDPNIRFGAGFEIDEPRSSDYNHRWQFEDDHAAFDRFVDAGTECVERGLEKKSNAPIHKCNAIRQRVDEVPPMGVDLIGETDWWEGL